MYIDHKGQLYLEETEPKNYVTCIKDPNFFVLFFLNQRYFYQNLFKNRTTRHRENYKYVSKCWGEFNFVKCFITPIVYNDISHENGSWKIVYSSHLHSWLKMDISKILIQNKFI